MARPGLTAPDSPGNRHAAVSNDSPSRLDLIVVCIRVDIPADPHQAETIVAALAFELQSIRLSEQNCIFATMSSDGMRIQAVLAFLSPEFELAFLFAFRIRMAIGNRFSVELGVGIGTGRCCCRIVSPLSYPIMYVAVLDHAT